MPVTPETREEKRIREEHAAIRRAHPEDWPSRVYNLGKEPDEDLSETTTMAERVAMVWQLTLDAWASAGEPIPDYPREKTPIRVIRRWKDPASGS
jgi:hypothetical protein